jgi:DNA-binding NtrC family response regulator
LEEVLKALTGEIDLILTDVMLPGFTGYDVLQKAHQKFPTIPIILMTAYGTIEKAVAVMKNGAYDFLVKPFSLNVLEMAINAAFMDSTPSAKKTAPIQIGAGKTLVAGEGTEQPKNFITRDIKMIEILESVKRIAASKATVLIQGESGTGKELIARMIHDFSPRAERIFVAINCAAMPDTLLESELFGHEKGAFTGAVNRQIGKFELSNNGTILLDEISEMSLNMQTKLLRVLQECEIYRVGGNKPTSLNLRVIATTNRNLYQYTQEGHFREDLFYRLNVIPIKVPPLRERGQDILFMAQAFLQEFAKLHGRAVLPINDAAQKRILNCPWYGNVRELRNAMERAILVGDFHVVDQMSQTPETKTIAAGKTATGEAFVAGGMTLDEIEQKVILSTLEKCGGNKTRTASQLGISLRTLRNKLKTYISLKFT